MFHFVRASTLLSVGDVMTPFYLEITASWGNLRDQCPPHAVVYEVTINGHDLHLVGELIVLSFGQF